LPLDRFRQFQQPEHVADGRTVQAQPSGQFLDRQLETVQIILERGCLLQHVQILPLEVLLQRDLAHLLVAERQHAAGDDLQAGLLRRDEPAFTGDELIAIADRPDEQRLQHAVLADAVDQFVERGLLEVLSGLKRVAFDQLDVDFGMVVVAGSGAVAVGATADEGVEAAAQPPALGFGSAEIVHDVPSSPKQVRRPSSERAVAVTARCNSPARLRTRRIVAMRRCLGVNPGRSLRLPAGTAGRRVRAATGTA
jgi:hypothetical protein